MDKYELAFAAYLLGRCVEARARGDDALADQSNRRSVELIRAVATGRETLLGTPTELIAQAPLGFTEDEKTRIFERWNDKVRHEREAACFVLAEWDPGASLLRGEIT